MYETCCTPRSSQASNWGIKEVWSKTCISTKDRRIPIWSWRNYGIQIWIHLPSDLPEYLPRPYVSSIVDVPCPSLLALPVMKQWDLDICAGKRVIQIHTFGVTIPFEDGLPYVDIFDAKESGTNGSIPTVFKRTFEEQNSGKAVFKQLPNVIGDFWTTKPVISAAVAERRRKIMAKVPTTRPFQKVLIANKESITDREDFDFGQE